MEFRLLGAFEARHDGHLVELGNRRQERCILAVLLLDVSHLVTTDRLIHRHGVLAKHGIEIPLERVNNVLFSQRLFERVLGAGDLIFRQATVKGFWGSVVSKTMDAETRGALFGELSRYLADGTLTLPVAATFGLDDIVEAVTASDAPRVGKVLLRP